MEANGQVHYTTSWRYVSNTSKHDIIKSFNRDAVGTGSSSVWQSTTTVGDKPAQVIELPAKIINNGPSDIPVLTGSIRNDGSEGYFVLGVSGTFPVPKKWLPKIIGNFNYALNVAFALDTTWAQGTYSSPEGLTVNLYGFGDLHKYSWDPFRKVGALWVGGLAIMGLAAPTETYPLPHVVIDFKVEVVGVPSGTAVRQDWDSVFSWSTRAFSTLLYREPDSSSG